MNYFRLFIRLSRPLPIIGVFLTYSLGAGIARYLGASIAWEKYIFSQIWITLLQLSANYLGAYFEPNVDNIELRYTLFSGQSDSLGPGKIPRSLAFWAGVSCLAFAASLTVLLLKEIGDNPSVYFLMILISLGILSYCIPPFYLASSGYGELLMSIIVTILVPALAFLVQSDEWSRILPMATFPLLMIHLAMMIAFGFPDYGRDIKYNRSTMLVRMGWLRGMKVHNVLLLTGFGLIGVSWALGLPFQIALPPLIVLPVGAYQIWMLNQIEEGGRPNWLLFTVIAAMLFGVTAYLLAYGFWTR